MKKIKELFTEYYILSYYPGQKPKHTKDIGVKPYMILRTSPLSWTVLNLWNGTSIIIPINLIDIFNGFNIWGGWRVLGIEPEDNIEKFITQFLLMIGAVEKRDMKEFLRALGEILGIETTEFRKWLREETGIKIGPIEIESLNRYETA